MSRIALVLKAAHSRTCPGLRLTAGRSEESMIGCAKSQVRETGKTVAGIRVVLQTEVRGRPVDGIFLEESSRSHS